MIPISNHAERRMQQRGCTLKFVRQILDNADSAWSVGAGCCLYRVHRRTAASLKDERLGRFGIIVSDITGQIVTVLPIDRKSRGARYRRAR